MKKNLQQGFTLIELLVVIGIIAVLAAIVLIAINPARQFRQARNAERSSEINAILNAVGQSIADTKGTIPASITTTKQTISKSGGADLCASIAPKFISALPVAPNATGPDPVTDCAATYATGYSIMKDSNGRITVYANNENPDSGATEEISVTR